MAERKLLYLDLTTDVDVVEIEPTDTATFGGLTLGGNIDMNSAGKIANANAATVSGDALVYGQTSASLGDLTVTSGGDITVSGGGELVGLPSTPSGDTAAVSKAYVDATAQELDVHDSVRAATTAAGTLASDFEAGDAIDNITLVAGDRILVKNQASGVENGIYTVEASGTPTRATDWAVGYEAAGAFTFIEEGDVNADSGWVCTNDGATDTTGTDALVFSQFSGAGQITAGDGLSKTGNTLDVGAGNGISVAANTVAVNVDTTSAVTTSANAILADGNGVRVAVDDSTLEGSLAGSAGAETLRVKDGGITGAKLDPAIVINTTGSITATGNIETTAGIFTGDGSGLTNLPSAAATEAPKIENVLTTATDATTNGDAVYINGNNTVGLSRADTPSTMRAIGVIRTGAGAAGSTPSVVSTGPCAGVLSGATAGNRYYVQSTGGIANSLPSAGETIFRVGYARNATDLWVDMRRIGRRAA